MTAKETVMQILDGLPDDCSIDDVLYHLYVVQTVERGARDAESGRTVPHEQVVKELREKWLVGRAE